MSDSNNIIKIKPGNTFSVSYFNELLNFKDLLWYNIQKNIKSKYRQMALGPLWIIFQPLFNMIILSFVFGRMASLDSEGIPYPLLILTAIIPWTFFQNACIFSSDSLVRNMHIISKVYFPRMIIPLSETLSWFLDYIITLLILFIAMAYYNYSFSWTLLFLPLYLIHSVFISFSVGLMTSCLSVRFRDVKFVIQFGIRILMYLTPVAYTPNTLLNAVPEKLIWLIKLNPMYHVIEGFRWCFIKGYNPPEGFIVFSIIFLILIFLFGVYYFRKTEKNIVDLL